MFRRTKAPTSDPAAEARRNEAKGPGAKGHPTPTRREAEAAARERAKMGMDKKSAHKVLDQRRSVSSAEIRQGMKRGDERFLPPRDRGPVRRFVRDWVDSRLNIAEFLLPLLLVIMALIYSGQGELQRFGNSLWAVTLLVVLADLVWTAIRLRRTLKSSFPDSSLKGTTFYALVRVLQVRPLRMPKPQVRIGGAPK